MFKFIIDNIFIIQRRFLCFLLILFLAFPSYAQFNHGRLSSEHFYTEVPFEYVHDKIVIEASMNGVRGRYLLDTGAMCILFKDSMEHHFLQSHEMKIGDASGKKRMAQVVQMPLIEVGELQYENIPTLYVEMFEGPLRCLGYKGIIGSNLLRFGAFKIDWENQKLIIADNYQVFGTNADMGARLHVNKQQSSPFIKMKVNGKDIKWVLLDTGSGDAFSLFQPTETWLKKKQVITEPDYTSTGTNSHGAWGAGEYKRSIYRETELQIGNRSFTKVSVETSGGKSKIGMKLLEKGSFIIDYPQKRFFFDIGNEDEALQIESFGMDLVIENDRFVVNGIWQGSLAEELGVEKGDVIEDIEGFNLGNKSICELFLSLKELTQNMDELTFVLRKPEAEQCRKVTLRRIKI